MCYRERVPMNDILVRGLETQTSNALFFLEKLIKLDDLSVQGVEGNIFQSLVKECYSLSQPTLS